MQKNIQVILGNLRKHYLVIFQIVLMLILLNAFLQATLNKNKNHLASYEIDKIGKVNILSPLLLLRDSEKQEIDITYLSDYSGTQPLDIEIMLSANNPSIIFTDGEIAPVISFSGIPSGVGYGQSIFITKMNATTSDNIEFLVQVKVNGDIVKSASFAMKVESQYQFLIRKASPYAILFLFLTLVFTLLYQNSFSRRSETDNNLSRRLEIAEVKADELPDKVKPIWDVARFTLEKYINRNQQQINLIFTLSLGVMLVSFIIIVIGVYIAIQYPASFSIAVLTSGVGVITEFIGATFLLVFKSTLKQASDYSKTLERIATIGVAVQILDSLVDDPKTGNMKSKTKSEVVKLLIKNTVITDERDENEKN